jgi:hypothetical protein
MIFILEHTKSHFAVQFKPINENLKRMRNITGATFSGDKHWYVPLSQLHTFEQDFKGEYIYITPRHLLTGDPPPRPPGMYKKIPKHAVNRIKKPYTLYDYQSFGANFIALMAAGAGHAFLTDSVGTGSVLQSAL